MKKGTLIKLTKNFEESAHVEAGIEYWMARDIQILKVIEKAKNSCQNSGSICSNLLNQKPGNSCIS